VSVAGPLLSTGLNSGEVGYGRIVGAEGSCFLLDDGTRLLDGSNTAGPLGHGHPEIVEALRRAAAAPAINEGWLWPEREEAARDLIEIAFGEEQSWVGAVRFFLSGSEANDLALSLAQALTGRSRLATRERAYHGMTGLARAITVQPHWHGGLSSRGGGVRPAARLAEVVQLPAPLRTRIGSANWQPMAPLSVNETAARLDDVAAVIVDYTQGGVYYEPAYQDATAAAARRAGTLWIADEVVTGLGRQGGCWFAFQGAESRPDIVTLGKPLAGGGAPGGAVVVSRDVLDELEDESWQTYSTFRGHPLTVAAVRAYLRVVEREGLLERVADLDARMEQLLREVAAAHPAVARVDGQGLHWTVEVHGPDWREWRADTAEDPIASRIASKALEAGALIGTSGEQTSLFLAPPLTVTDSELEQLVEALGHGLGVAD
jgi:4-aminobutyrate aminotransferase-like enzyme